MHKLIGVIKQQQDNNSLCSRQRSLLTEHHLLIEMLKRGHNDSAVFDDTLIYDVLFVTVSICCTLSSILVFFQLLSIKDDHLTRFNLDLTIRHH